MSTPEIGNCSVEAYERGKRFIVEPDRLCVRGIYTFAFKAGPDQKWLACRLPAQVTNIARPDDDEGEYLVTVGFENLDQSGGFQSVIEYPLSVNGQGLIEWPAGSYAEEAYLKHRLDAASDELEEIIASTTPPFEIEVPDAVPALIS